MKIGLDIHGVIDKYPKIFARLSKRLWKKGHQIHIITGESWETAKETVNKAGIVYTHHFSIVDYHLRSGTKMEHKDNGWWMDRNVWVRSKGDYIHRKGIEIHFDDSYEYAEYCPDTCVFVLVPLYGFENFMDLFSLFPRKFHS